MGYFVKGVNMPRTCTLCDLAHAMKTSDGTTKLSCAVRGRWQDNYTFRPIWCPLQEVQTPHGDLIDRDETIKAINKLAENMPDLRDRSVILMIALYLNNLSDIPAVIKTEQ